MHVLRTHPKELRDLGRTHKGVWHDRTLGPILTGKHKKGDDHHLRTGVAHMQAECPDCKQHRPVRIVADPPLLAECFDCGGLFEVMLVPVETALRERRPA